MFVGLIPFLGVRPKSSWKRNRFFDQQIRIEKIYIISIIAPNDIRLIILSEAMVRLGGGGLNFGWSKRKWSKPKWYKPKWYKRKEV